MRHRIAHRKLGRVTEHRIALLRNQAEALLRHERINTTVAKAKELRPFVERLITTAKRGLTEGADSNRALHARRLVRRALADKEVARKLFDSIAPRFSARAGGYTRLLRVGRRQGDDAELAQVELVGSEYTPAEGTLPAEVPEPEKARGVGGGVRRAAQRILGRGRQGTADKTSETADSPATKRAKRTRKQKDSKA